MTCGDNEARGPWVPESVAQRGAAAVDDVLHGKRREHDAEQALLHRVPGVADHLGDLRRREKTETGDRAEATMTPMRSAMRAGS